MLASLSAQDQIAALIADSMPEQILHFKFSEKIQQHIMDLVNQKKVSNLSISEKDELEKYLTYDLLIRLAKARAYKALHKTISSILSQPNRTY